MATDARPTPGRFADATWDEIAPWYDELAARPLDDPDGVGRWLADWSALEDALSEAQALAGIAYSADTADPAKEEANLRFLGEIGPRRDEQGVRLAGRLLDAGYRRADLETTVRRFANRRDLFRPENMPHKEAIEQLNAQYQKLTGGMTALWDGEELPLPRLAPFLEEPDRDVRERAFRLLAAPFVDRRDEIADLFDAQYARRQEVARNTGFANYRDFVHREKERFDYTPDDCLAFDDAVAEVVVPAIERRLERRRRLMGLDVLRPWDTRVDPVGRPPLRPYQTAAELTERTRAVFGRVDPVLGEQFATLAREGLLDLESRVGKEPGGFCAYLPVRGQAFIFMNAAGTADDVTVLLHEAGHAFHAVALAALPLTFQAEVGAEIAEVASMAMELLAAPYLAREAGGFYDGDDARRARAEHLEAILGLLAFIARGDAFQHWVYTSGEGHDRDARDAAWQRFSRRFDVGVDWDGLEAEQVSGWSRQIHFFVDPFYFVEYGFAQLAALQIWRDSLDDQAAAVARYRAALALGATRPLPELYATAGARLAFDPATIGELVSLVEGQLAELDA